MRVAICQTAPVFLDRAATTSKVVNRIGDAAARGAHLVAFGETLIPGYPLWLERTDGARFESPDQKRIHALYLDQAVCIERGDFKPVVDAARDSRINVIVGVAERPLDRGGHSVYCTRVFINDRGEIASTHRKLMPTYEERLAWSIGDGAGLVTHAVDEFTVGSLNCWENWMPLARAALYAAGEDLHVAIWPGSRRNTSDITRFIAFESRSFVLSACGIVRASDIPAGFPFRDRIIESGDPIIEGGSCIAGPDGNWIIEPVANREELLFADIDHARVREARQSFDAAGHYARPDVLRLTVDRRRQRAAEWIDEA
ncbi:MAG: carbon-nitrogen hydrolase family protein [Planctomycetota bacterium]|nr:carbon-nitrogen hydrolase family protein [Planctomycetota bacterium]